MPRVAKRLRYQRTIKKERRITYAAIYTLELPVITLQLQVCCGNEEIKSGHLKKVDSTEVYRVTFSVVYMDKFKSE